MSSGIFSRRSIPEPAIEQAATKRAPVLKHVKLLTELKRQRTLLRDSAHGSLLAADAPEPYPDPIDQAATELEHEVALQTKIRTFEKLRRNERALQLIRIRVYGQCRRCHIRIPYKRLKVQPDAPTVFPVSPSSRPMSQISNAMSAHQNAEALPSCAWLPESVSSARRRGRPRVCHSENHSPKKEDRMRCTRCTGMRVPEVISEGGTRVLALRCVHCGDIVDRVIIRNRLRPLHPQPGRARTPIYEGFAWETTYSRTI
jgi:RNA polymerase-binding transcription factor DksA